MGGSRFGIGDALAIIGAVGAGVGLALYWWVLQIDAKEGHIATFSLSGSHYALAWLAGGLAWVAGVAALLKLAGVLKPGRVGALVVLVLGVAAAGVVGVAVLTGPSVSDLEKTVVNVFPQSKIDELKAAESGKTDVKGSVEYGIGLWITLAAGAVVALGGVVKLATEKSRAAWPYGMPGAASGCAAAPYGQAAPPGYAQAPPAGPPPGFAAPPGTPPMMGPVAPTGAPPVGYAPPAGYAAPAAPPVAPAVGPLATPVAAAATLPVTPAPAGPSEGATTTSAAPADGSAPEPTPAAGFCGACGAPFADDAAKFCMKCGAARPGA